MAKYDMTGHFRDLSKPSDPKKPGLTQGAQKRVDQLKQIKAQLVTWTRTIYGPDSSAAAEQFQYQEHWFQKNMVWCQANGFKKTASAMSDFLDYLGKEEIDESLEPELAHVIVSINADLQMTKRIFGTKATLPHNVYVEQLKNQLSRMKSDVNDPRGLAVGWFHTKWDAFLKRQVKVAKKIGANEIVGLIDTLTTSNNPNVIKEACATLQLKLAALK